jgi:2,4-dienoyl-CoA reductase-like NADH-dependent reductase (Old Yellow Enzyme family)/pyruvate/2-oxoglutarate dehydrogenase complex dihydrolipoamide dehydrogenase (E3) component
MSVEKLMQPASIGNLKLRNRIAMPPMTMAYADETEGVSQTHVDYFSERAKGGVGLIIVGGVCVEREIGQLFVPSHLLCIDRDDTIPGYKRLVDAVHSHGAKIAIQLYHAGRQTSLDKTGGAQPVSASDVDTVFMGVLPMPSARALSLPEIEQLEDAFADAAERAKRAGFDAVLIDGGAGYLIAQFMSPFVNKRTDAYGGDFEGRMRFPLRIVEKTRKKVGADYPLLFDLPTDELIEGGICLEESQAMARALEEAGIQGFRIHVALYETYQYVVPPASVPRGVHAERARAIKESVRDAKVLLGHRINDPLLAEDLLQREMADVILVGRPLIADPEFCNKAMEGRPEDIRKCIACNIGCVGSIVTGTPATCTVNPAVGREKDFELRTAAVPKKVLIVGGGVGGMEAARVAASRGHQVALYERQDHLGGWGAVGCIPPHKQEIRDLIDYFGTQLKKLGVEVHLGRALTPEDVLAEKPDAVILATGSEELLPPIPGADQANVLTASDVLTDKVETGHRVVIVGGGQTGLETAEFLSEKGKNVTVLEMLAEVGQDMELMSKVFMMPRLAEAGIEILTDTKVEEIHEQGVRSTGGEIAADSVVMAVGLKALDPKAESLREKIAEVYEIGDCVKPRRLLDAIHEGARVAMSL